jgi:hypothetical protein
MSRFMSEETRAKQDQDPARQMTADEQAQHASDTLKAQIAALRNRVKKAQQTLSAHAGRTGETSGD